MDSLLRESQKIPGPEWSADIERLKILNSTIEDIESLFLVWQEYIPFRRNVSLYDRSLFQSISIFPPFIIKYVQVTQSVCQVVPHSTSSCPLIALPSKRIFRIA